MIEFVQLKKDVKKEYLDDVIDPKHLQLNKQYLEDRIKDLYWTIEGGRFFVKWWMVINIYS